MKFLWFALAMLSLPLTAQQSVPLAASTPTVPRLVNFSGKATDLQGKPIPGVAGVTFAIYKDQYDGAPLWLETQNVQADARGNYTVQLGASSPEGLPLDLFTSGEARWLGVQLSGQPEQPRILLLSVPYALKAADAETVGGLPASAFALANGSGAKTVPAPTATAKSTAPPANPAVTGKGVANYIPIWDTTSDILDSALFQKGSDIGIGTITPAATLDVDGKADVRDTLTLFPNSTHSSLALSGTTFKIDQTGKMTFIAGQTFPGTGTITGITTASGSGLSGGGTSGKLTLQVPSAGITNTMLANSQITLNANTAGGLTTPGAMTLGNTYTMGLKPCSSNQVLQYSGTAWNCAAAGTGTITGITTSSASGLSGGGTSGTLNLSINPAVVPELMAANSFTNLNSMSVNSTTPALTVSNASGFGLEVTGGSAGDGIYVPSAGGDGVTVFGTFEGAYFNGVGYGVFTENDTDTGFYSATFSGEYGSTQQTFGLWGYSGSTLGVGTYGEAAGGSNEGDRFDGIRPIGSWGDSNFSGGIGELGTVDTGYAGVFYNNAVDYPTTVVENDETSNSSGSLFFAAGSAFGGFCDISVSGDLYCSGTFSPTVPVAGGTRKVSLNSISSPEHWFEDAGAAQLSNGEAVVNIESIFGETVNTSADYHVFLTPDADCKGLYVMQKSPTAFVVRELGGGTSNIAFEYRIMAKRKGFEEIRLADKTHQVSPPKPRPDGAAQRLKPNPQEMRKAQEAHLRAHVAPPHLQAK